MRTSPRTLTRPAVAALALLLAHIGPMSLGCAGASPGGSPAEGEGEGEGETGCYVSKNDEMFRRLKSSCESCHNQQANKPFFASLQSFEANLVADTRYVRAGDADRSRLVQLLEGTATGRYTQMPTWGDAYAQRPQRDDSPSMEEVRAWIDGLGAVPVSEDTDKDAPTVRRLTAEEITTLLMEQLGLTFDDDFISQYSSNYDSPTVVFTGDLPVWSPDWAPRPHYGDQSLDTGSRWSALGGPRWQDGAQRSHEISPSFLQTLTQVSQAWCRMAVEKPDNTAFFAAAARTDTSTSAPDAIRANIAALQLRMLVEPATAEDVELMYTDVFVAHEPQGTDAAWVAVCSAFVLHPQWLSL